MIINKQGFTIIEVLVAGVLMIILGMGILGLQSIMGQSQLSSIQSFQSVSGSNQALSELVREIRTARRGEDGSYTFEFANDNEVRFYADINADGVTEKLRYFVEGGILKKSIITAEGNPPMYLPENETVKTIIENLRNTGVPIFTYFSGSNEVLPTPADLDEIRMIKIYVRTNTFDNPASDFVLQSQVQIRTLKEDL